MLSHSASGVHAQQGKPHADHPVMYAHHYAGGLCTADHDDMHALHHNWLHCWSDVPDFYINLLLGCDDHALLVLLLCSCDDHCVGTPPLQL